MWKNNLKIIEMKKWIVALLVMSSMAVTAQEKIQWMDFEEAMAACTVSPKKVFVDVYTDWCGWCKRMDQTTFQDPAVVKYMNENFYAVKFDAERADTVRFLGYEFVPGVSQFGRKATHQLAAAMLQNKMSYPSYVIFNEKQQVIQVIPGYQEAKNFLPILHFFGDDAFVTKTWKEFLDDYQK